eukprot:887792-Pyramimonas_sp.AAC.1
MGYLCIRLNPACSTPRFRVWGFQGFLGFVPPGVHSCENAASWSRQTRLEAPPSSQRSLESVSATGRFEWASLMDGLID